MPNHLRATLKEFWFEINLPTFLSNLGFPLGIGKKSLLAQVLKFGDDDLSFPVALWEPVNDRNSVSLKRSLLQSI